MKKLAGILLICLSVNTYGQDHYNNLQYGGQATLTGGTNVTGVSDNSSLYYNPGACAFTDSASISVSTHIYGFEFVKLKNGAGNGLDLKSLKVNILPQMIAGGIKIKRSPNLHIVFGTFTRTRINTGFTQENENQYEVISKSTGLEYYKARVEFINNSVEQWAGFTVSYKLNEHWSLGLASFGAYTHIDVRTTQNVIVDGLDAGSPYTTTVNEYNALKLDQITHLFKLGVAARFGHVHLGLSITPPGIKIWGEGKLEKSFEGYNLNKNPTDTNISTQKYASYVISDVQKGLKSHYKIPLSASFGLKFVYPKFTISASLDYYMGYKNHTVLQGMDRAVTRPASFYGNDTIHGFMQLQTSSRFILNGGLGAEVMINPTITMLIGARTDFSNRTEYIPNNESIKVATVRTPSWDYIYLSGGFAYKRPMQTFTVGLDYGIGFSDNRRQVYNLTEPKQETYLRGSLNNIMRTTVQKVNLILSYIYYFKPKEKKHGPLTIVDDLRTVVKKEKLRKAKKKAMENKK